MKRDMNLIREILLWAENQNHGYAEKNPEIKGYSEEEVGYHVYLMQEAGLVEAIDVGSMGGKSPNASLRNLLPAGHDFIGAIEDSTIWAKAKNTVLKTTPGIALDIFLGWAKNEVSKKIGLT